MDRVHRPGGSIEDFCRACKTDRTHTIVVLDDGGWPLRVTCDYCQSQHNYRGGPRIGADAPGVAASRAPSPIPSAPIPSEDERTTPLMTLPDATRDLELLLRRIIREEAGVSTVTPAQKW